MVDDKFELTYNMKYVDSEISINFQLNFRSISND